MKISIKDRIVLQTILPAQGDFITLVLKETILLKVKITQEEIKELGMTVEGNVYKWDDTKPQFIEIEFTEAELALIVKLLKELDESKKLDDDTKELYKLFV